MDTGVHGCCCCGLPAYISLTANGGRRVILSAGAAGRSRFFHDLLEGLHVMNMAIATRQRDKNNTNTTDTICAGGDSSNNRDDAGAAAADWARVHCPQTDLYALMCGGGEECFTCFARAFPCFQRTDANTTAATPTETLSIGDAVSVTKSTAAAAAAAAARGSPLLEVPLACVEADTLARIAEFLVEKSCQSAQGGGGSLNSSSDGGGGGGCASQSQATDPLRGLDCTSHADQLTAIRLLLGSDLLGC